MKCSGCFKKIKATKDNILDPLGYWHIYCYPEENEIEWEEADVYFDGSISTDPSDNTDYAFSQKIANEFHHLAFDCDTKGKCGLLKKRKANFEQLGISYTDP